MQYFFIFVLTILLENDVPPKWYMDDIAYHEGEWIAVNSDYKNEDEPFDLYIIEWELGVTGNTLHGKLYGRANHVDSEPFWEFYQYWDVAEEQAVLIQTGTDGTLGKGEIHFIEEGHTEFVQVFTLPDGRNWSQKHTNVVMDIFTETNTSFYLDEEGEWLEDRTYIWVKQMNK